MSYQPEKPEQPLLPGENPNLREEIIETIGEDWLNAENIKFGGRRPNDLIGKPDEIKVRNVLRSIMVAALS